MTAGRVSRIILALIVTAAVSAALYWVTLRNDVPEAHGMRVSLDLSGVGDGAAPTHFDTGQLAVISRSADDQAANLVVSDHLMTLGGTLDARVAAAYYSSPDMNRSISGIGARWVFLPREDLSAGSVNLIVANGAEPQATAIVPPIPLQLVVTPINWNLNCKRDDASGPVVLAAGVFAQPLAVDGVTAHEASVSIVGSRATIRLPDGSRRNIDDARISQWRGNFATFGLYSNNGLTDSVGGLQRLWATSIPGDT